MWPAAARRRPQGPAPRAPAKVTPSPTAWRRRAARSAQTERRRWAAGERRACSGPRAVRTEAVARWMLVMVVRFLGCTGSLQTHAMVTNTGAIVDRLKLAAHVVKSHG